MNNIEFKVLLRHLGKDVIYMGHRVKTEMEKSVFDLDLSHDTSRFCQKLAETLRKFSEFTQQYAKDLEERIKNAGREEDCAEAVALIQQLVLKDVNCNSCKSRGPLNVSFPKLDNDNDAAPDGDVKIEAISALSQCSSLYISAEDDLKQEPLSQLPQTNDVNTDGDEASQNEPPQQQSSSDQSSDTLEYNFTEALASKSAVADQECSQSSVVDDVFDRETVMNSPPILDHVDALDSSTAAVVSSKTILPDKTDDEFNASTPPRVEAAVLSPNINVTSSEPDTIRNDSTINEHVKIDSIISVHNNVTETGNEPDSSIDESVPGCQNYSETSVANVTPPRDLDDLLAMRMPVSRSDSDTTIANVTPPRDLDDLSTMGMPVSQSDSDITLANATPPREPDKGPDLESCDGDSQIFSLIPDADFEIQTPPDAVQKSGRDVLEVDIAEKDDYSDVDFDAETQVNYLPEDSNAANLIEEENNEFSQLSENSRESDMKCQQDCVIKDAATVLKEIEDQNNHDDEKLQFLESLGMVRIEAPNLSNETCSPPSGGSDQVALSDSVSVHKPTGNSENGPLLASVEPVGFCLAQSAPNAGYDSDVFGDISESETSIEATEGAGSIASRKLKYKQKKSLLKLISEYYLRRKREQERAENSCSSGGEMKPVEKKRSPRKKREDKKRSPFKTREKGARRNLLFANKGTDDSIVDIQEDSSDFSNEATILKRKVSIEDYSDDRTSPIVIEHNTSSGESSSRSTNRQGTDSSHDRDPAEKAPGLNTQVENGLVSSSVESDLQECFRKKTVLPLRDTLSDVGELESSQPVNPFKRAIVLPLPDSQTTVCDESQEVSPFKKKVVLPLPSSDSEQELTNQVLKRPRSPNSGLPVTNSEEGSKSPPPHKRLRVDTELNTDDSQNDTHVEPSQFKLTDNDRDDLLEMLNEHTKDIIESKKDVTSIAEVVIQEPPSQFKLADNDRDDLLNLLSDKEREEGTRQEEASQFKLDSPNRDELLSLLKNGDRDTDIEVIHDSSDKKQFKLGDEDRDQLLDLLSQHVTDGSGLNSEDEQELGGSKKSEKVNREVLLELLNEYEEARVKETDLNAPNNSLKEIIGSKGFGGATGTHETDLGRRSSCSDAKEDSDVDSVVLDVLREEAVEASEIQRRRPGRPRDQSKEAWAAYESLLQEDEDVSDISSDTTDLEMDDLENDFSDQERKQAEREKHAQLLKRQFGIHKELIVNVNRADISGFDVSRLAIRQRKCSDFERLCDLSSVLQKRKLISPRLRSKLKKRRPSSASSGSILHSDSTDSDLGDSTSSDRDSSSERTSPLCTLSEDEEQERLANALWEDIKNSSDEVWSSSHDATDSSDDEEKERKQKKKNALSLGRLDASSSKKNSDTGSSSSSSSESEGNDSKGEGKDKTGVNKRADLDSSDEEDFVGVRKGQGAWRRDPLLNNSLSSNSEPDTDHRESRKKRLQKRKTRKPQRESGDSFDSDETMVNSDDAKEAPKEDSTHNDSDDSDFEIITKQKTPQKVITIVDDEDTPGKTGKGRRNIRALVEDEDLAEATQRANNEEKERIRRLEERDRAKESLTQSFGGSQPSEEDCDPLILDLTEDIQIKVHPKISKKLKPHQRTGIQFMWDSCYESVKQLEDGWEGSGCILAHCMGLGKTLQALALIQTLFSHPVTKTRHVLVVCPLSTVSNWRAEFNLAYKNIKESNVKLYTIQDKRAAGRRFDIVHKWWKNGGVLVLGYECFGMLIKDQKLNKWENQELCRKESILKALVDPGPDLVICDEGHLLRNKQSQRTLALNKVKTRRRIVLTGTPLQNNLLEYYYMVDFVKPNLLGTEKEFKTNFVNPISNGQFEDSTAEDIMFMKKRTHVLHKILNKTVQRVEDTELKQYLPKLVDQAVFVKLSDLQVNLYNTYLDMVNSRPLVLTKSGNISRKNFLADVQILRYICSHPNVITTAEKNSKAKIKEQDVIDDNLEDDVEEKVFSKAGWYKHLLSSDENNQKLELGTKMLLAIGIVEEAVVQGDKVLIFAQSYADMDTLESFLAQQLNYKKGRDYYRMDGTISPEVRSHMCDKFNRKDNNTLRVFIMSTKVGGLGLNLTAANRVVILNVNWNPSYDTQSVFRSFRFGQNKAVFVYRLIALDTMEEKIYQRGVTKLAVAHRVVDKHQITRHYSAADIQEFYSARPSSEGERPVPNVPEDRILAKLVQKHQFLYRWHEHQALLANRPEEDLDEHQKNAAWEEFNKKDVEPPALPQLPGAQPETSGMSSNNNTIQNRARRGARRGIRFRNPYRTNVRLNRAISGVDELNSIINESLSNNSDEWINDGMNHSLASINIPDRLEDSANIHYTDHDYSLPKPVKVYSFRMISSDDFLPIHKKVPSNPKIIFPKTNKSIPLRHPVRYVPRSLFVDVKPQSPGDVTHGRQSASNVQVRLVGPASTTNLQATLPHKLPNPINSIGRVVQNPARLNRRVVNNNAAPGLRHNQKGPILKNRTSKVGVIQANQNDQRKVSGIGGDVTSQKPIDLSGTRPQVPKRTPSVPPLVSLNSALPITATAPAAQQSPLQQQMRTFMDHLHRLQKQMTTTDGATSTDKGSSLPTPTKGPLNAARNLSNFPTTKTNGSLVRLIGPASQVNGKAPPYGQAMRINGVPVTRLSHVPTSAIRPNPKSPRGLPSSPGMRKVIVSQNNDSTPNGARVQTQKPPVRIVKVDSPGNLTQKIVANLNTNQNRLTPGAATSPSKIRHGGVSFRTNPARKNGILVLPPLVPLSKANKENIRKKRLSLRGANHNKVAASIDLSNDDDRGSASGGSLSQEVVNTLKKKGVSINYVADKSSNDVIKLD